MSSPFKRDHYDVIIAGARCAGASTAMLLARMGMRVLVVDPGEHGTDTLSTHALMRPGVLQLYRWGLLDAVRSAGTPPVTETTFHYGDELARVSMKPRDGVDALYAPRRTVLDAILANAAIQAGAEVAYGYSLLDLLGTPNGTVTGAVIAGRDRVSTEVTAGLVVGADGRQSRVARLAGAEFDYVAPHATSTIYGYWQDVGRDGFHWHYRGGASVGSIPTNDGDTCVFAAIPPERFERERRGGIEALYMRVLTEVSPDLADRIGSSSRPARLRAFAGDPGFLRRSAGPGWALVGDAGYFKDPITAHGITDALRDAELLARAASQQNDHDLVDYEQTRNQLVRGLLDVTDRIASFAWDLESLQRDHLQLIKEMATETQLLLSLGPVPGQLPLPAEGNASLVPAVA